MMPTNLPPLYNLRARDQWQIISREINFEGKSVIDLGCGYCDILARVSNGGARLAMGIEVDRHIVAEAINRLASVEIFPYVRLDDLEKPSGWGYIHDEYDVAICFSVLPYLKNWREVLTWMSARATTSLIEAQYVGDGPGETWEARISNDEKMHFLLRSYWRSVAPIGKTFVKGRDLYRTIWLCR